MDEFTPAMPPRENEKVDNEQEDLDYLQVTWEPKVAARIRAEVEKAKSFPFLVGLVGLPGSGKLVSSFLIADELEKQGIRTMIVAENSYHYPLEVLEKFPEPEDAIYRRGAPDTLDPLSFARDLDRMKNGKEQLISLPEFDHQYGDPVPNKHVFDRSVHQVVLCEGLYMLYDEHGWDHVGEMFDMTIHMGGDIDTCIERLKVRNQCIPGYTPEEIAERCEKVDRANADLVLATRNRANLIVDTSTPSNPIREPKVKEPIKEEEPEVEVRHETIEEPPASYLLPTWEPRVAERIKEEVAKTETFPYMVSLVGLPGSGKTVSAFLIANLLEKEGIHTMILPQEGYHIMLHILKRFADPEDAVYRRGAPDTLDPYSLARDLNRIRNGTEPIISLPGFDHHKGDPEPDKHVFDRNVHKVVLCEGLYTYLGTDGWEQVGPMFDLSIYMESDLDSCIERLKIRNRCIPAYTPEEIAERCEKVDRANAEIVESTKERADWIVDSPRYLNPTWEPQVVKRIKEEVKKATSFPYMVALVGIPGSGKSVSSLLIANMLEKDGYNTMIMPHDGYHYPLSVLETFPDPQDAIYRRGAPDTFDPLSLARDLERIKTGDEQIIYLPAFDHHHGDPEPNKHIFDRDSHKIVLCEGLYLLHDEDGWERIPPMFDLSIFMNSDVDACVERVKIRNQCIPGYTPEEIAERCEKVDRANAMTVMHSKVRANIIVESLK